METKYGERPGMEAERPIPNLLGRLVASLDHIASSDPDPKVREAAARDAAGYRTAWQKRSGGSAS